MALLEMGVLADKMDEFLIGLHLRGDDDFHTLTIGSGSEKPEDWLFTFDFRENQAEKMRHQLIQCIEVLDKFIDGDRGGPTPETLRHAGVVSTEGSEDE